MPGPPAPRAEGSFKQVARLPALPAEPLCLPPPLPQLLINFICSHAVINFAGVCVRLGSRGEPSRGGSGAAQGPVGAARVAASRSLTAWQGDTRTLTAWPAEGEWLCREAALCQALPRGHLWALAGSREARMEGAPQLSLPPPPGPLSCPRGQDPSLHDTCPHLAPVLVLALSTCTGLVFTVCPCSPVPCWCTVPDQPCLVPSLALSAAPVVSLPS